MEREGPTGSRPVSPPSTVAAPVPTSPTGRHRPALRPVARLGADRRGPSQPAVAVAMADSPAAGLVLVDDPALARELDGYHLYAATRADLLRRCGRFDEAADSYRLARDQTNNVAEHRFLDRTTGPAGRTRPRRGLNRRVVAVADRRVARRVRDALRMCARTRQPRRPGSGPLSSAGSGHPRRWCVGLTFGPGIRAWRTLSEPAVMGSPSEKAVRNGLSNVSRTSTPPGCLGGGIVRSDGDQGGELAGPLGVGGVGKGAS